MTEQTHEFEMLVHALKESRMDLPEKFQLGHWSKDCPVKKTKKPVVGAQANIVLGTTDGSMVNMIVGEVVASGINDGYVTYNPTHGLTVTMGNVSAAQVLGIGNVDLKFAFGRVISLTRVHHVPDIRRNIINGSCLVNNGFELSLKCHTGYFSKVLPKVGRSTAGHTGHISEVILMKHGSTEQIISGHTSVLIDLIGHFDLIKRSYKAMALYLPEAGQKKKYTSLSYHQTIFSPAKQEEKPFDLISSQAINSSLYC
ncbi:hypothetical protein POM88_002893 [Heracleum sosnowskyi]|uniref:Retrovirus-related Pol polyprotein from transposon TNT 1-94-like beta-barrel domain-containing protein n=1 Tax=Heracleum sosnowskyi TaxID=360622 RepID=A0AAD8JHL2_9APIA|nr:hypothetical protein POM88_002893 [Heracleum sosnowskyi]